MLSRADPISRRHNTLSVARFNHQIDQRRREYTFTSILLFLHFPCGDLKPPECLIPVQTAIDGHGHLKKGMQISIVLLFLHFSSGNLKYLEYLITIQTAIDGKALPMATFSCEQTAITNGPETAETSSSMGRPFPSVPFTGGGFEKAAHLVSAAEANKKPPGSGAIVVDMPHEEQPADDDVVGLLFYPDEILGGEPRVFCGGYA